MRKPRAGDPQDLEAPIQPGHVELTEVPLFGEFAAVLWVPDPEQRHWWREYYIRSTPSKPNARPIGFSKPR